MPDAADPEESKKLNFWDSMPGLILLVVAILLARTYILEPYKIPSGSMEPTLVGHEDFGDRILTNKLAFAPAKQVYSVIGGSIAIIALCFLASKAWQRKKAIVFWVVILLAIPGGLLFALSKEAVASDPKRFDVTVFSFNEAWDGGKNQKINYIKRLWGLPGEEIRISGGDIFLKKRGDYEIIRKPDELQESLWFPVASTWPDYIPPEISEKDKARLRFPWDGAEAGRPGAKLEKDHLELDGSAPITLKYAHQVSNIYLKQGRWPFIHHGCPAVKAQEEIKDENGITWRNPKALTENITAYIGHTSHGVVCPNCKQLQFPITDRPTTGQPNLTARGFQGDTNFHYGGDMKVGDLHLEMELDVVAGGSITLHVGSNLNRAVWNIGGETPGMKENEHTVKTKLPALSPGKHTLSLSYYDGIVRAELDGKEVERREITVAPLGRMQKNVESRVQISFEGFKGSVTKLDLERDFFYTSPSGITQSREKESKGKLDPDTDDYMATIPPAMFLMMGDNSPGSSDGRKWGFVPREELMGRAGVVWWPPSRWRSIK